MIFVGNAHTAGAGNGKLLNELSQPAQMHVDENEVAIVEEASWSQADWAAAKARADARPTAKAKAKR